MASRKDPRVGPTTVGVIDLATGSLAFDPVSVDGSVTSAVFLPDGRLALAIGEDGRLVVVDAGTGAMVTTIDGVAIPEDDGAPWRLDPVLLRPSSVALAGEELLLGAADGTLRILDAATLQLRRTLELRPADTVKPADPQRRDGGDVGKARDGPHRSHHREDQVERPRHVEVHQPPGDRARGRAVLRRPVRAARRARPRDRDRAPTARRPEREQRFPVVRRRGNRARQLREQRASGLTVAARPLRSDHA